MLALKFLAAGAIGPYSRFVWPKHTTTDPGAWVTEEASLSPCARGIHACLGDELSLWLAAELWLVELGGKIERHPRKIVAERGRLLRRIEGWDRETFDLFGQAAIWRARNFVLDALRAAREDALAGKLENARTIEELTQALDGQRGGTTCSALAVGYFVDALTFLKSEPAVAAFCAAHTTLDEKAFWQERAWQSQWIVDRLGLEEWANG